MPTHFRIDMPARVGGGIASCMLDNVRSQTVEGGTLYGLAIALSFNSCHIEWLEELFNITTLRGSHVGLWKKDVEGERGRAAPRNLRLACTHNSVIMQVN